MLNQSPNSPQLVAPNGAKLSARPVVIVYEVREGKRTFSVSVALTGAMACGCGKFKRAGECQHLEAVRLERESLRSANLPVCSHES